MFSFLSLSLSLSLHAIEADVWVYEIDVEKITEAEELFRGAIKVGQEVGQNVGVGMQQIGRGGDLIVRWYDFYESPSQRAKTRYSSPKWDKYVQMFWDSEVVKSNPRNYQMRHWCFMFMPTRSQNPDGRGCTRDCWFTGQHRWTSRTRCCGE